MVKTTNQYKFEPCTKLPYHQPTSFVGLVSGSVLQPKLPTSALAETQEGARSAVLVAIITHRIHGAGIYANIWGILMGSMLTYIAYMDPMG